MNTGIQELNSELSYRWRPFTLSGVHLTFRQHVSSRLERSRCSHWGPAVYKWQGVLEVGPNVGKTGVLIGETSDLRQRIKQYVSGTQKRGNQLWRETFLTLGDIRLYILEIQKFLVGAGVERTLIEAGDALASNNTRLVMEQLLVLREVSRGSENLWIVNARQ